MISLSVARFRRWLPIGFLCASAAFFQLVAAQAKAVSVVINEVMYHPPDDRDDLQYIELFNAGTEAVDISGWSFAKGVKFTFRDKLQLAPGGFAVVCRDVPAFTGYYGKGEWLVGDFQGKLSHGGERLELVNAANERIDSLKYSDKEPWPSGPDGYSCSLERICPSAPTDDPNNWAASKLPPAEKASGTPGRQNDNFSAKPLLRIAEVTHDPAVPDKEIGVTATVSDATGVKGVTLSWLTTGGELTATWSSQPMQRTKGDERDGVYHANIPAQGEGKLVRFVIRAEGEGGRVRNSPGINEPRPTYSCTTLVNTNQAQTPFMYVLSLGSKEQAGPSLYNSGRGAAATPSRGVSAIFYAPPGGGKVQVFDHVRIRPRKGGFKVHFQKDQPLNGMTGINVIYEGSRYVLAEPLAYDLYRLSGVPAPATEHDRLWLDGRPRGFHLVIEQPNKSFLKRNKRDEEGNLYKLLWYENGVVRQHEKKTNLRTGHDDIVKIVDGLNRTSGTAQWNLIQENFNVQECINYYAVNMCIQNWDGFFNNYYAYHDLKPGGKWEIFPWDEDKTWGDSDAGDGSDWYDMPLTMGMNGDEPGGEKRGFFNFLRNRGPFGGTSWWRPPGFFSGPLLANPEFRKQFLARLREVCETVFIPEKMMPLIDGMEKRLEPEVIARAAIRRENTDEAVQRFHDRIESFRKQVINRRKFILKKIIEGE